MSGTPEHARRIGKLYGGRPKGKKNKATLEKEKVMAAVRQQILKKADKLINSQVITALGTYKIVVIEKVDGIMRATTVRDNDHMDELLNTGVLGKDYLIVAGSVPDWKAGDALLNRALGKATEHIDVKSDGEKINGFTYVVPKNEE